MKLTITFSKLSFGGEKLSFVGLVFLSFLFLIPQQALAETEVVEINQFCFRKDECPTYGATAGPYPDPACETEIGGYDGILRTDRPGHNLAAITYGYIYNCYANQEEINLQVSIGGYKVTGIETYIKRLYIYLVGIAGIVSGIMIVWAGVKWLTSAGAPEKITDAKKKIGNAIVGLVLVLASYLILQIVNPALVSLKLPPVKIVRKELIDTQEWCVKRTEFPCGGNAQHTDGQWDCSDPAYLQANPSNPPCGQPKGGKCYGQYCAEGGCQRIVMERFLSQVDSAHSDSALHPQLTAISRKCFDPARCNNCNIPLSSEGVTGPDLLNNVALCISTACNCLAISESRTGLTTVYEDFQCIPLRNPGEECHYDVECKSGNCNQIGSLQRGRNSGHCTQQGGEPDGNQCAQDEDCRSGLCNKNATPNECVARGGIPNGQDCSRSTECQSEICGYSSNWAAGAPGVDPVCLQSGTGCEYNFIVRCNAD